MSDFKKPKVRNMILFANGSIAAFDVSGEQIPDLQSHSAIELFAEWADTNAFCLLAFLWRCQ